MGFVQVVALTTYVVDTEDANRARVTMVGRQPTLQLTVGGGSEVTISPATAAISTIGQTPTELRDTTATPGAGVVILGGLQPAELRETRPAPGTGLISIGGLSPNALGENQIAPATGLVTVQGLAPTIASDAPVVATITPDAGLVTIAGLAPTYGGLISRSYKRRRGNYGPLDYSLGPDPRLVEAAPPEPLPEPLRVPLAALAKLDLRAAVQATEPIPEGNAEEERRQRIRARRRREEMAIISILLAA